MTIGLFLIRLVIGLTMAAHGSQKLFGWFDGGGGISGTAPMFEQLGFRPARAYAALAGMAELAGGLLLAAGLLTPLAAAAIAAVMLVAMGSVHVHNGFFVHKQGYEYNLVLAATALGVAFAGPGPISLDQLLELDWSGIPWGLAALGLGLVAGAIPLALRTPARPETAQSKAA